MDTNTSTQVSTDVEATPVCENCEPEVCTCDAEPTPIPKMAKKTSKRKSRPIEALEDLSPRSMTDTEMRVYIEFLRGERNLYKGQALAYENNAESAFKKAHLATEEAKRKVAEMAGKLEFAKQAVSTCYASILYASKGE